MFSSVNREKERLDAEQTAQKIKSDVRQGAEHVQADLSEASQKIKEDWHAISDNAASLARNAGQQLRGYADNAAHEFNSVTSQMRHQVRENPISAGLITFVVGALFGAFMCRK